jgi:hypothetical protein
MLWGEMVRAATIVIIIYFIKLNKLTLQTLLFSWNLYGSRATSVRFPQKQPYQTLLELPPFTKFGKACCYFVFYWEIISPISWAHQGGVPPLSPSPRVGPRRSPPPKSWPLFCGNSFLIPPPLVDSQRSPPLSAGGIILHHPSSSQKRSYGFFALSFGR